MDGAVASTGWDTMLTGLLDSWLRRDRDWPVRSELATELGRDERTRLLDRPRMPPASPMRRSPRGASS